ncbi:MAG TPA: hypothetical protein VEC37_09625 [Bacillota bacterium]|nr:hypothetical protein [Bacillota bacterium]
MRFPGKMYVVFLSVLFLLAGCTDDLGRVDLSGEIKLQPANKGWAYRNIASTDLFPSRVNEHHRLIDFRDGLELEKTITMGQTDYMFVTRFTTGFKLLDIFVDSRDESLRDFQTLVYSLKSHRLMKTFITKQSDSGDPWDSRVMLWRDPKQEKKVLEREGVFHMVFQEPDTGCDCIVESDYSIESTAKRQTDADGKPVVDIDIDGKSRIKIGFRQCLAGEKLINNERIEFYVLDWDFDGQFTENDMIWNDYTKKMVGFNEEVRLTGSLISSKDNTYVVRLVKNTPKTDPEYLLKIELKSVGKRKK